MPFPDFFIKNVYITIHNTYELDNTPFIYQDQIDENSPKPSLNMYFPKKELEEKFIEFLKENKGSYLVTGHRGSGKTTFINKVIDSYNKEVEKNSKPLIPVRLNLAQSVLTEIDVLRMMVSQVYDKYFGFKKNMTESSTKNEQQTYLKWWYFLSGILLVLIALGIWQPKLIADFFTLPTTRFGIPPVWIELFVKCTCYLLLIIVAYGYIRFFRCQLKSLYEHLNPYNRKKPTEQKNKDEDVYLETRLKTLNKRCYAAITSEESDADEFAFEPYFRFLGKAKKKSEVMPAATAREIEHELSFILTRLRGNYNFIFLFDELDKIDPPVLTTSYYQEIDFTQDEKFRNNYLDSQRIRKQAVINLIASMKSFITTAPASFVFIAGREIFDASLADIADRQSSLSSIFNYVFNIDSFLKEKVAKNSSLSKTIERYICRLIFGEKQSDPDDKMLFANLVGIYKEKSKTLSKEKQEEGAMELFKVSLLLQNFIIYLTYRTNGSPKRLIRTIHEFVRVKNTLPVSNIDKNIFFSAGSDDKSGKLFLYFNYHNQYKIGFINYLYRPFLIKHGKNFKQYSDNIITSTSYLFDHLLKFHPFGFNLSSLELIPEVLSTNKTPTTKEHLKRIVEYLMNSHVKETEIGLFNYKFYNKTLNELSYQSKIFETESAAFNFTLDESYLVKAHVRNKIKELRSIYARFNEMNTGKNSQIHSISYLNDVLGDLHFFDEEYDDSIVAYSDGIKALEDKEVSLLSYNDFATLIISMLKIGLCYEKTSAYEKALSWYTDASLCALKFITCQTSEQKLQHSKNDYKFSTLIEMLQISNQAFLAMTIVEEKMSIESNSIAKLPRSVGNFFNLLNHLDFPKLSGQTCMIRANTYLVLANMFYYRNTFGSSGGEYNFKENNLKLLAENVGHLKKIAQFELTYQHRRPFFPLALYLTGLDELLSSKSELNIKDKIGKDDNIIEKTLEIILSPDYATNIEIRFSKYHFKYLSIFLSCIGDCLLSSLKTKEKSKLFPSQIFDLTRYKESISDNYIIDIRFLKYLNRNSDFTTVIKYYYLSAFYFMKLGRGLSASFQLRKILYLLKSEIYDCSLSEKNKTGNEASNEKFLQIIKHFIIKPLLHFTTRNSEYTEVHMYNKYVEHLEKVNENKSDGETEIMREKMTRYFEFNLSNHPESREIHLLYCYISLKIGVPIEKKYSNLINPYNSISTQYSRIMELEYYALVCRRKIDQSKKDLFAKIRSLKKSVRYRDIISYSFRLRDKVILDLEINEMALSYVSALINTIRILNFYGSDYMIGFSHQANLYYKLGLFYYSLKEKDKKTYNSTLRSMKDLMGNEYSHSLSNTAYYFTEAKLNYEKAIQLHSTGSEYNKAIDKMIYLEDDFNDNSYHFGAALDRFWMINNLFYRRIKRCEKIITELQNESI